jgi:hypothetical protein
MTSQTSEMSSHGQHEKPTRKSQTSHSQVNRSTTASGGYNLSSTELFSLPSCLTMRRIFNQDVNIVKKPNKSIDCSMLWLVRY